MIKIGICDDDGTFLSLLREEIEKTLSGLQTEAEFSEFDSGKMLLSRAGMEKFSLVFLDIEMPGMDGYQLARGLKRISPDTYVVFVSGHEELVFKSYEYEPLWFVRKGEIQELVPKVIRRYIKKTQYENNKYQYRTESGIRTVYVKDIRYIEGNLHSLTVHIAHETFQVYGTLRQQESVLGSLGWIRCHRNYLVNIRYVELVEQTELLLTNGERIPVSKGRKTQVKEKLLEVL